MTGTSWTLGDLFPEIFDAEAASQQVHGVAFDSRKVTGDDVFVALAGAKADGKFTLIKRDDGMMQWAYDGKPLYTFVKDEKPGEMKGDGMKDVWHVVHQSQK